MAEKAEDLTINYEEDGVRIVKELDKVVLTARAWATVIFRYQEWDRKKEEYGADKYTIRRYRKRDGEYKQQSKFTISSEGQARQIIEALNGWLGDSTG